MSDSRYEAFDDPYCYSGTFVLQNKADIQDEALLQELELVLTTMRANEPLPRGRFGVAHYRNVHRHLFQDVYTWAGKYRTVRTSKGGNHFCFPENIAGEMDKLFAVLHADVFAGGASASGFVKAASRFLGELNAVHCFREGNGRAQLSFMHLVALRAGHRLRLERVQPKPFMAAMIASFDMNYRPLERELTGLLE